MKPITIANLVHGMKDLEVHCIVLQRRKCFFLLLIIIIYFNLVGQSYLLFL